MLAVLASRVSCLHFEGRKKQIESMLRYHVRTQRMCR